MVEATNAKNERNAEQMLQALYAANLKVSAILHSGEVDKLKAELD